MKEESKYRQKLKFAWGSNYFFALEPKACSSGIPDVLMHNKRKSFFVELKYIPKKKGKIGKILRDSQIIWHKKFPGKSFILIGIENEHILFSKSQIDFFRKSVFLDEMYQKCLISTKNIDEIVKYLMNVV